MRTCCKTSPCSLLPTFSGMRATSTLWSLVRSYLCGVSAMGYTSRRSMKAEGEKRAKVPKSARPELEDHPWIQEYLSLPSGSTRKEPKESDDRPSGRQTRVTVSALDDQDVDQIWTELAARREAWRVSEGQTMQHFTTQIRGGRWTKANLGQSGNRGRLRGRFRHQRRSHSILFDILPAKNVQLCFLQIW